MNPAPIAAVMGFLGTMAAGSFAISEEHGALIVALAATVGAVVGAVAWIDHRIERRIADHAREDELRHAAILSQLEVLTARQ